MEGPFQPTWESLAQYEIPSWYEDGKFGIFLHWGVYSVPAFGNEWYSRQMYKQGSDEFNHHVATYGPQNEFGYKDFIPSMTYERFDPAAYARLFAEAGAKFVVPVAEHHDGFAMYDSGFSKWCAAKMGPKRDVVGELANAVRAEGLVFGASTHRAEHFWFFDVGREFDSDVNDPAYEDFYGPAQPGPKEHHDLYANPPTDAYMEDWLARTIEIVDKYRPQLVWFD
jgi:alpha-L-fucosidase